ncbi:nitronate monooxygenase [Caminibacter mediatlanticus]|uniref:2-nitropropane dioxygenase, NPD n=1 Tax=Caminibacter mediatlanticus TB-2 TaxID=391592 RepID=A0AAI9AIX0_9BACT|nr:nitronate monooxygenase family protein [Caminibacter mediatlanticus]EDM24478.1 2-nitropropane dioxygenase, NPD [Caminibacter mediatlanticus TB-2]
MNLKPLKIGKWEIKYPIIQGGMGLGISWDKLAGNVSKEGCLGVISAVGTGYYEKESYVRQKVEGRPLTEKEFYNHDALIKIFENARKICGEAPLGCNVLYAINDYGRVVRDACEAGANIIITGAGLPTDMPEFTKDFPDVALVPIVSTGRAFKLIAKRWEKRYGRIPDAVIVEGPLSGGHQGFKYEDCFKEENQLENLIPDVREEVNRWDKNIPVIAAGGIWDRKDIEKFLSLGANGVQMGTRFALTYECDASDNFKQVLLNAKKDDIILMKSPVGYPARGVRTKLIQKVEKKEGPKVKCISNCVAPCHRGEEARKVGYCIADRLADAYLGDTENGLFFSGAYGYKADKLIHVKDLIKELVEE